MALADINSRAAVLKAIEEFDERGREGFLDKYGYGQAHRYFLVHNGKRYDSKAIIGVAHRYEGEGKRALKSDEFSGGEATVKRKLEELGFTVEKQSNPEKREPRFWWVNQGRSYKEETDGGFVWAPQNNKDGHEMSYHRNVNRVKKGDIIFHYKDKAIKGVSVATTNGAVADRPEGITDEGRTHNGWKASVKFHELDKPVRKTDFIDDLRELDNKKVLITGTESVKAEYLIELPEDIIRLMAYHMDVSELPESIKNTLPAGRRPSQAWIFQANPEMWDLCSAIENEGKIRWLVNQHESEISTGDRVFLWQSGEDAGVYGTGDIVVGPKTMEDFPEQQQYRNEEWEEGDQEVLRVEIAIDRELVENPIHREHIKSFMPDCEIITSPQRTNAALSRGEAAFLEDLAKHPEWQEASFGLVDQLLGEFEKDLEYPEAGGYTIRTSEHEEKKEVVDRLQPPLREIAEGNAEACEDLLEWLSNDNLVKKRTSWLMGGGFGAIHRSDFCVFLKNTENEKACNLLQNLFDESQPVHERTNEFRTTCRKLYEPLLEEGMFPENKTEIKPIPVMWPGLLLFCYKPDKYTIYKATEFGDFADDLNFSLGHNGADEKYRWCCDLVKVLLHYSVMQDGGAKDLIDAHSLVWATENHPVLNGVVKNPMLNAFADSLIQCSSYGSEKWGTYRDDDRLRLLLGSLIVMSLEDQRIWMALDKEQIPEIEEELDDSPHWTWDTGEYSEYSAVPSVNGYYTPGKKWELWDSLKDAHFSFLEKVADKYEKLAADSQQKHDSDVLEYLRTELDRDIPRPDYGNPNYWLVAPGRGARLWEEMHDEEIIALGWDKIGDYAQYKDRDAFETAIAEAYDSEDDPKNNAKACYEFIHEMKVGDRLVAKQGRSTLLGYGEVLSGYRYEESREEYQHVRDVSWTEVGEWELPADHKRLPNKTLTPKSEEQASEYVEIMEAKPGPDGGEVVMWADIRDEHSYNFGRDFEITGLHFPSQQKVNLEANITKSLQIGKHVILTGPPGTGKSKLAKEICEFYTGDAENYHMNTATSDWSTFDTIGGYQPQDDGSLSFRSGLFLKCFKGSQSCETQNRWLIIDEINRADIDKAFGSLFSALTGDNIAIPFEMEGETIQVIGDPDSDLQIKSHKFVIHPDWRIIATMNTFDKASLYEMSYAFMRRFSFIPVGIPEEINGDLIQDYIDVWKVEPGVEGDSVDDEQIKKLAELWKTINDTRKIGPALIEDMYQYVAGGGDWSNAIILFVLPQFEGLLEDKIVQFVKNVDLPGRQKNRVGSFCADFFGIREDKFGSAQ